jgi:phosphatidylinositol alpha 1,6-mannosyltransferase
VIGKPYSSYVAIGDSLSEGLGDFTFHKTRKYNGWTDRLAGLLAIEAREESREFKFANLSLRGSNINSTMNGQLDRALVINAELVTIMAGSNDLNVKPEKLPELADTYRRGLQKLLENGSHVIIANTINPVHLRIFKPLRARAQRMSDLITGIGAEFQIPVLDLFGISHFSDLCYWAEDMVHFSGHGHVMVANEAAKILDLKYRFREAEHFERSTPARGFSETLAWVYRDVIPYTHRKLKGVTSGDGMSPKSDRLETFRPINSPHWKILAH